MKVWTAWITLVTSANNSESVSKHWITSAGSKDFNKVSFPKQAVTWSIITGTELTKAATKLTIFWSSMKNNYC